MPRRVRPRRRKSSRVGRFSLNASPCVARVRPMELVTDTATRTVLRIISIIDTREYEEIADGRFAPVPGSGTENECSFCRRLHEVHATVELTDGSTVVIGTGCAGRGWARDMRRGVARAS